MSYFCSVLFYYYTMIAKTTNLTFAYNRKGPKILDDFSIDLHSGGIYGLLGRNGAGKSTLLYLLSGLLTPTSGSVAVDGENVRLRLPSTLEKIFIVPEEINLPSIPFSKYVELNAGFYPNFSVDDLHRHLRTMELDFEINLGQVSMGQKKKAIMCFALACNTPLLLMDEPTNGLDIPSKSAFRRFIVSAVSDDRIVVISSHQVRDIDRVLDHVILMDNHKVLLNKSVAEITRRLKFETTSDLAEAEVAAFYRKSLGGYDIITANPVGDDSDLNLETLFEFALTNRSLLSEMMSNPE